MWIVRLHDIGSRPSPIWGGGYTVNRLHTARVMKSRSECGKHNHNIDTNLRTSNWKCKTGPPRFFLVLNITPFCTIATGNTPLSARMTGPTTFTHGLVKVPVRVVYSGTEMLPFGKLFANSNN